jgi:phosphoribosylformimino-5-aminoimidazole carboxamide ribonucleotide (ProFAR) isomerase
MKQSYRFMGGKARNHTVRELVSSAAQAASAPTQVAGGLRIINRIERMLITALTAIAFKRRQPGVTQPYPSRLLLLSK